MKKIISFFVLVFVLFLSSCNILYFNCEHEFIYNEVEPTCSTKGYTEVTCSKCKYYKKQDYVSALGHEYHLIEQIEATCSNDGYSKYECIRCNDVQIRDVIPMTEHVFGEWEVVKEASEYEEGLEVQGCLNCDFKNERILAPIILENLEVFTFDYDQDNLYEFNSYDELKLVFDSAILNMSSGFSCNVNFEISDGQKLINDLIDNCSIPFSYNVSLSSLGNNLSFELLYYNIPNASSSSILLEQYDSYNEYDYESNRSSDFDSFIINNSKYTFSVSSSEQLFYCLENGVKPICVDGSSASIIYKEMKNILRNIISDDMSDIDKLCAIHDYLIMNVTYDQELLNLLYKNTNIQNYNGFYLEGVFLDKKAVCEGISKAFSCLANIEGISTVCVSGYQSDNPNGVGHAWNKSFVNGNWYIIDVTSDGIIMNSKFEVLSHKLFLVDEDTMEEKYIANNKVEFVCDSKIKYSDLNLSFNYKEKDYDFIIDSQEELNILVEYFYNNDNQKITIEFYMNFDYGTSISDEISKALNKIHLNSYSLVDFENNIFMLIK